MTSASTPRAFAIIGVVGKTITTNPTQARQLSADELDLLSLAEQMGTAIATAGCAVLTGGHHERPEASVKYRAMIGAKQVADAGGMARIIGILPESISKALNPRENRVIVLPSSSNNLRCVYVHTQLASERRNPITGQAVDVLLALRGGPGTAQEVAAALSAGRPVVFVDSLEVLGPLVTRHVSLPASPLEAPDAQTALEAALAAIGWQTSSRQLNGEYPDFKAEYERGLGSL